MMGGCLGCGTVGIVGKKSPNIGSFSQKLVALTLYLTAVLGSIILLHVEQLAHYLVAQLCE
jgi:hypothetical protein